MYFFPNEATKFSNLKGKKSNHFKYCNYYNQGELAVHCTSDTLPHIKLLVVAFTIYYYILYYNTIIYSQCPRAIHTFAHSTAPV